MQETGEAQDRLLILDCKEKKVVIKHSFWTYIKAVWMLLLGTFILTILATPVMETVQNLSSAANIPSFFISFTVFPLAINYRGAISAISSIRQRTKIAASLTFSEVCVS